MLCLGCGDAILSFNSSWRGHAIAVKKNGEVIEGEVDKIGRIDFVSIPLDSNYYHAKCYKMMGFPRYLGHQNVASTKYNLEVF